MADFPDDFENVLAPLREKHGEVCAVMTVSGPVVFRGPTGAEFARYQAMIFEPKDRASAGKSLCLMCVVSPERTVFSQLIEKKPGLVATCTNPLLELAGVDTEAQLKK